MQCVSCKQLLHRSSAETKVVVCKQCRSMNELETGKNLGTVPPNALRYSRLSLGMTGVWKGLDLRLLGFIQCEGRDDEDVWYWEEWWVQAGGHMAWLEYAQDENVYYLHTPIGSLHDMSSKLIRQGKTVRLPTGKDAGVGLVEFGKVVGIDGELPWSTQLGERIGYADAKTSDGEVFALDWTDEEVECFQKTLIEPAEIAKVFNIQASDRPVRPFNSASPVSASRILTISFSPSTLAMLVLVVGVGIASLLFGMKAVESGNLILKEQVVFCPDIADASCVPDAVTSWDIVLDKPWWVYRIEMMTKTRNTGNTGVVATLQPAGSNKQTLFRSWFGEGSRYNYEEEEYYTVFDSKADFVFRLSNPGTYTLGLHAETATMSDARPYVYEIAVYEKVILSRYFFILAFLCMVVVIVYSAD